MGMRWLRLLDNAQQSQFQKGEIQGMQSRTMLYKQWCNITVKYNIQVWIFIVACRREKHKKEMEIEDSVLDQSRQCSTVCRQIVFALGGLAWAFIYGNKDNHVFYPVLTLIFVVLYMAVDICQYLYYYLATRPLVMQLNKAYFHPDYTKTERERMRKDCEIKKIKI